MQTVGEILRAEREKKGLSIKDVEQGTSIRGIYLQAIDDGNYKIVPGEVYLKGFIRNYANYVGLNSQEMVDLYRHSQLPEMPPEEINEVIVKPKMKMSTGSGSSYWKPVLAFLIVVALATTVFLTMMANEDKTTPIQPAPEQSTRIEVQPAPPTPPVKLPPPPAAKPVVVEAKFIDQSWTQVVADGKDVYEGIPKVGETLTWTADRTLTLKVGNAAAVNLTYNGQVQGKLGNDGEVVLKTFNANVKNTPKP